MTRDEFFEAVIKGLPEYLPGILKAEIHTIYKNNKSYPGLSIIMKEPSDTHVTPTIDMEPYYQMHRTGVSSMNEVLEQICGSYTRFLISIPSEIYGLEKNINNYEWRKERLCIRLCDANSNPEFIQKGPYTPEGSLAAIYYIDLGINGDTYSSTRVTESMVNHWGITIEQLHQDAMESMRKHNPPVLNSLQSALFGDTSQSQNLLKSSEPVTDDFLVLSSTNYQYGASYILDPEILNTVGKVLGKDYYLLPSSQHEMIIVSASSGMSEKELAELVYSVNRQPEVIQPEDRLSDRIHHYDPQKQQLTECPDYTKELEISKKISEKTPDRRPHRSI